MSGYKSLIVHLKCEDVSDEHGTAVVVVGRRVLHEVRPLSTGNKPESGDKNADFVGSFLFELQINNN